VTSPPDADEVLATLDPEQREVATALSGPVCVLAGAGTGKTRAITSRIAYGVATGTYVPQRVLAVTFTARAAGAVKRHDHPGDGFHRPRATACAGAGRSARAGSGSGCLSSAASGYVRRATP